MVSAVGDGICFPGVGGRLDDVDLAFELAGGGAGEGGLADPRLAEQSGVQRRVVIRKERPRRQQLQQHLALTDPGRDLFHRPRQVELDAVDFDDRGSVSQRLLRRSGHFSVLREEGGPGQDQVLRFEL